MPLRIRAGDNDGSLEQCCLVALLTVCHSIISHRGALVGDDEVISQLCTHIVANDFGSRMLGDALDPVIRTAADAENFPFSAKSGETGCHECQRRICVRQKVLFGQGNGSLPNALVCHGTILPSSAPDYWRKFLLEYEALGEASKYGAMLTGHELAIIDQKLDRYMAEKARAGTMPHLLIDRFRFDSFSVDTGQGDRG